MGQGLLCQSEVMRFLLMKLINKIFPKIIDNNFRGSKIAVYGYYPIIAMMIFRSLTHFLSDSAGLVSIGNINVLPIINGIDPNNLVYLFASLWGASQLILTLLIIIIFFRYKSLVPLLWIILIIDILFRFISGGLHPLTDEYYSAVPPGKLLQVPLLIYGLIMFLLSIKQYD